MILVWLPSFALAGAYTGVLAFQFLRGSTGGGSDTGWFFFAGMMEALIGFPIVITAFLLLVFRPVKIAWHPRYYGLAIVPTVVAPIVLMAWFKLSKPVLSFAVTNEAGSPLEGVAVRDVFNSPSRFTTDRTGLFHDRVPHRDIFGCCFTSDGYQEHHVTVYRAGAHGETYYVDHAWIDRSTDRITVTDSQRIAYQAKDSTDIPVVMKRMMPLNNASHPTVPASLVSTNK